MSESKHSRLTAALVLVTLLVSACSRSTESVGETDTENATVTSVPDASASTIPEETVPLEPATSESTVEAEVVPVPVEAQLVMLTGTVDVLDQVWFVGSIDGTDYSPPQEGRMCAGTKGYADLAPGASVIVSGGDGAPLAVAQLSDGSLVHDVKGTEGERQSREELVDSIFGLRVAIASGDPVAVAQLNLDRANQRLADLSDTSPLPPPFEGHPFGAAWCRLTFSLPTLPIVPAYQVTVTNRGATTFTRDQLEASGWVARLTVG